MYSPFCFIRIYDPYTYLQLYLYLPSLKHTSWYKIRVYMEYEKIHAIHHPHIPYISTLREKEWEKQFQKKANHFSQEIYVSTSPTPLPSYVGCIYRHRHSFVFVYMAKVPLLAIWGYLP